MGFASRVVRRIRRIWEELGFHYAIYQGEDYGVLFSIACAIGLISLWVLAWLGVKFLDLMFGASDMSAIVVVLLFPILLVLCTLTLLFISGPGKELGRWIFYVIFSVFVYFLFAILVLQALIAAVVAAPLLVGFNILDIVLVRVVVIQHLINFLILLVVYVLSLAVSPGFLWSRWFVIRPPRCRTPGKVCEAYCESPRNSLCGRCTSFIRESALITGSPSIFTNPVEAHNHHTQRGLLQSATHCHLCSLLKDSAGASETAPVDSRPTRYGSISQSREDSSLSVVVSQTRRVDFPAVLQIRNDPERFPDSAGLRIQRVYGLKRSHHQCSDSWETPAFGLAKKWIQSCTKHSRCRNAWPHIDPTFRPTRLIKVTSRSSASLVETDTEETSEYLVLSHCWGKATIVTLNSPEKLKAWKISLPVRELAKNFQDAIRITFGLGFEYLWIDSICIIQGNELDWEKESARMGYVYANAACTISATASDNAQGGCFFSREPFKSDCTLGVDIFSSLVATPVSSQRGLRDIFETKVEKAPLTSRAWTFQERILSKRVLHFSEGVLLFECSTILATEYHSQGVYHNASKFNGWILPNRVFAEALYYEERLIALITNNIKVLFRFRLMPPVIKAFFYILSQCAELIDILSGGNGDDIRRIMTEFTYYRPILMFPVLIPQKREQNEIRSAFRALGNHPQRKWDLAENLEFHQQWFELVGPYSARDLTNHTDRLVAIIGIATFIQEHTGSQFLAGLWRTSLAWDLLWNCKKPNSERRRSTLLPTWSWASVDGAIQYEFTSGKVSAHQTASNDRRLEDIHFFIKPETWVIKVIKEQSGMIQNATLIIDKCLLVELQDKDKFLPDVELDRESERLFMMPIVGVFYGSEKFKDRGLAGIFRIVPATKLRRKVYGIVLRNLATQPDAFERVGYFSGLEAPILERALINAPGTPNPEGEIAPHEITEESYRWRSHIRIH